MYKFFYKRIYISCILENTFKNFKFEEIENLHFLKILKFRIFFFKEYKVNFYFLSKTSYICIGVYIFKNKKRVYPNIILVNQLNKSMRVVSYFALYQTL